MKHLVSKDRTVTIIPFVVILMVLFGFQILQGKVLFWGAPSLQFIPWWQRVLFNFEQGQLPLWNPDVGMGAPLLANYQSAIFYPPNWVFLFAGLLGGSQGMGWIAFLTISIHILWAAFGMFKLAGELGLNRFAQIISAMAFGFSGYLIARAWFLSINAAVSWLPWIMLFSYQLIKSGKKPISLGKYVFRKNLAFWFLIISLSLQLLSGHAQTTFYTIVLLVAWSTFWLVSKSKDIYLEPEPIMTGEPDSSRGWGIRFRISFLIGLAIFIAVGLAAIQLVPTAEYLLASPRSTEVDYEIAMSYSMWPWRLIGIFAPNFFGNPAYDNFWGYGNYWEDAIYIGMLPIVFGLSILLWRPKGMNRSFFRFLGGIVLISFILALGKNTPIYPFLYQNIPTFDMFQAPTRWSLLGIFALSLLAGIGSEFLIRPTGKGIYWSRLGTAGAFAITLGAGLAWLVLQRQAESIKLITMVWSAMLAGLLLFFFGLIKLTAPTNDNKTQSLTPWHWFAVFVLSVDLCISGWGLNPGGSREIYPETNEFRQNSSAGRIFMSSVDESYLKYEKYFQFQSFNAVKDWTLLKETFLSNNNSLLGTASVLNYDPLVSARLIEFIELIETSSEPEKSRLMNLANVSIVVKKDLTLPSGAAINNLPPGPYLRWYSCARIYPETTSRKENFRLHIMASEDTLFLETQPVQWVSDCMSQTNVHLQLIENRPQYKHIRVESDKMGWVFVSESYFPGWKAKLNGEWVDIFPANLAFQAVSIPTGTHQLELIYQPESFTLGSLISLSVFIISLICFLIRRNRNLKD